MKKRSATRVAAMAEVAVGSPSSIGAGVDVSRLYIDMLCEKFKDRGIRTSARTDADAQSKKDGQLRKKLGLRLGDEAVCGTDPKYRNLNINGRSYMSSDDFAAYYKDLRDFKLPRFYSNAEREYKDSEAQVLAEGVQESGKPPKKAVWLAITRHAKNKIKEIPSHLNKEELREFAEDWFLSERAEEITSEKKARIPRGVITTLCVITLSLMLVVCSSVMVSRASAAVSSLEDEIDELSYQIRDLEGKLEVKNNMLDIKEIAVGQYGMISADYASARYVDVREPEEIKKYEGNAHKDSWIDELLGAIGLKED